jgi:hypothetical protein
MAQFGQSGTIYDSPPVQSFTFKVRDGDLAVDLGGGFQAAHVWVNNRSNQYLYLPDTPDVVPPKTSRVVACRATDIARASWTIPVSYAVTQPLHPRGAAILVFLNGGVDIAPHPGVTDPATGALLINPTVVVTRASAAGQPVIGGVPTTEPFVVGNIVNVLTQAGKGPSQLGEVFAVDPVGGTITLATNLLTAIAVGDIVMAVPLVLTSNRKRVYDFYSSAAAPQGTGFQVVVAGIAGLRHILNHVSYIVINTNAAGATGVGVTARDNSSAGVILWQSDSGIEAVTGSVDRCEASDIGFGVLPGDALYVQEEANVANTTSSVAIGGYNAIAEPT